MARKHKITEQTDCRWRQKFGAMDHAGIERLRELETESAKLEQNLAAMLTKAKPADQTSVTGS